MSVPPRFQAPQLVVTLGPASFGLVGALATAGATAFRLNASHLSPGHLSDALGRVRTECPDLAIVVDLQGAKMRVEMAEPRAVRAGQRLRVGLTAGDLVVPHPEVFAQVRPGETLSIDDGRVRLEILEVDTGTLVARAIDDGRIQPRKGLNIEQHPIARAGLTERDCEICRLAAAHRVSTLAFSFMIDGREAAWLRREAPGCQVVGKIERREAADALPIIAARVDAVWICRGDLGAQLAPAAMARFVRSVEPRQFEVPVLMAGQVLEHLTRHERPTRSEVCHLFDLVERGYAGFVLSDETAIGDDPVRAVALAAELLRTFRR